MSRTNAIAVALLFGFVVYVTAKGRLGQYAALVFAWPKWTTGTRGGGSLPSPADAVPGYQFAPPGTYKPVSPAQMGERLLDRLRDLRKFFGN